MKLPITSAVFLILIISRLTGQSVELYNELLSKYVSDKGNVNYTGFKQEKDKFQMYLDYLSSNKPDEGESDKIKLAYWINAYNAFTIKLIIDNYPIESITKLHPIFYIPGVNTVWHEKFFKIEGEEMSLDQIEHEILRKQFEEVRIHFAINCASKSCPQLRNEAYSANKLEEQLSDQTRKFLKDDSKNTLSENEVEISKIFSWFKGDFDSEGGVISFMNKYSDVLVSADARVNYKHYDWRLNE